jgi:transposase-like protein
VSHFTDERAAFLKAEGALWPEGPVCPHCGARNRAGRIASRGTRIGFWCCLKCRRQFRVTIGTVFERSHVPLRKWLLAIALLLEVDGIDTQQLHLALGVTYKTALRMAREIERALERNFEGVSFDAALAAMGRPARAEASEPRREAASQQPLQAGMEHGGHRE